MSFWRFFMPDLEEKEQIVIEKVQILRTRDILLKRNEMLKRKIHQDIYKESLQEMLLRISLHQTDKRKFLFQLNVNFQILK